jgi:hypothetical protein
MFPSGVRHLNQRAPSSLSDCSFSICGCPLSAQVISESGLTRLSDAAVCPAFGAAMMIAASLYGSSRTGTTSPKRAFEARWKALVLPAPSHDCCHTLLRSLVSRMLSIISRNTLRALAGRSHDGSSILAISWRRGTGFLAQPNHTLTELVFIPFEFRVIGVCRHAFDVPLRGCLIMRGLLQDIECPLPIKISARQLYRHRSSNELRNGATLREFRPRSGAYSGAGS